MISLVRLDLEKVYVRAKSVQASVGRPELLLFKEMDQQRFIAVLSEVAAVGQGGLQIHEACSTCNLKNLPGSWRDLALTCLIHVGT